ncbi:MAG: hypothetical protein A3F13_07645 [Gammaproteobacteria bacterium RIFCSPHIGHO2_12_FULL_40_19]|nr:MAG: hypothetical protein A3F13_07645 [Gammaproteobacteria bacterium RIFCSPHIGHO2_12_FULL_40_19]
MIKKSRLILLFSFLSSACSCAIHADDLIQVYNQALASDPVYAQAESNWHSIEMTLPIAQATYLTQVAIIGNDTRNYTYNNPESLGIIQDYNWQYGYSLLITQPIFNLPAWESIKSARATVKAATASFFASQQQLIQRTVIAYFNVLRVQNTLKYIIANKKAVLQQLTASEVKYKKGVIAITDVYNARSSYNQILAQQITAENSLDNALEALHLITGRYYTSLHDITRRLPLIRPIPAKIDRWVITANQQNYNIIAQKYNVIAAMDAIKQKASGGLPVLSFTGGYSQAQAVDNVNDRTTIDNALLGLNLAYNPIQGGLINASTKQARYNYLTAASRLEEVHRQVVSIARSSYVGIQFMISQIQTDQLRVSSARDALAATEAGLTVGTRTMVDVLSALTTLYEAEQRRAVDQYAYIDQYVALKAATSTLSVADLVKINSWLDHPVAFHPLHWD